MLQGTFNEKLSAEETARRIRETLRILRPGGIVHMHLLTADRDLGGTEIRLPGPAAAVQAVPIDEHMLRDLAAQGFANAHYALRGASPCFRLGEAELRETRIEAVKPD
jgi:hypothetical protein